MAFWRRGGRRLEAGLTAALFVALAGLFVLWGAASPVGSSADEDLHLTSIWCAASMPGRMCEPTSRPPQDAALASGRQLLVPAVVGGFPCYKARTPEPPASCLAGVGTGLVPGRANDGNYPGAYYRAMHVFVGDGRHAESTVWWIRLVNALLGAGLVTAAVALTAGGLRRAVALGWLVGLSPLTAFLVPSVNPSSWLVMGLGTFWAFLLRFLADPRGRRGIAAGVLAVVTAVMSVSARTEAPAFLAAAALACLVVAPRRWRDLRRRQYLACYAAAVLVLVLLLARYGASGSVLRQVLQTGVGSTVQTRVTGWHLLLHNLGHVVEIVWFGLYGWVWGLGWGELLLPRFVGYFGFYLLLASAVVVWRSYRGRKLAAVAGMIVVLVVVPLYLLQRSHTVVGMPSVEPRYLLPLVLVFLGILFLSLDDRYRWRLPLWALVLGGALVAMINAVALHVALSRYAFGSAGGPFDLAGGAWWWAHGSAPLVWVLGSLFGIAAVVLLGLAALPYDAGRAELGRLR